MRDMVSQYPKKVNLKSSRFEKKADIVKLEKLLSDWFGGQVILLASGRSGLNLYLQAKGFHRYKNKFGIPPYCSRCVVNSITPNAFPVEISNQNDGMLFYHQYGFPQRIKPKSPIVLEDIAHSFFSSPTSGNREWKGEAAVFSLPKFFGISGMAGGLIVHNQKIIESIKNIINESMPVSPHLREWTRETIFDATKNDASYEDKLMLESAYELLLKTYTPDPMDLFGFPDETSEICRIGELRRERVDYLLSQFGHDSLPANFWDGNEEILPFAFPYFGKLNKNNLIKINNELEKNNIHAGVYHFDINRNVYNPNYIQCVLLPCHHEVSIDDMEEMVKIIKRIDK